MKILSKLYIHPFTYIFILIALITGLFKDLITFLFIIIIHESGHLLGALIFNWNIEKIMIMPFGGITIFKELINKPLKEELIIVILGPLFQLINYIFFKDISSNFRYYNYGLFIFNFLPIYPLDGYKFFSVVLEYFLPFKKVMKIMITLSFILIFILIRLDLVYLLVFCFLFIGTIKEYRNINYIYNRFMLERITYSFNFKRRKIINNINHMYKDCVHLIRKDKLITEREYLKEKYEFRKK